MIVPHNKESGLDGERLWEKQTKQGNKRENRKTHFAFAYYYLIAYAKLFLQR